MPASDEVTQTSGLLGIASLLPEAHYGTPHLSKLLRVYWLNPFVNGWFISGYKGLWSGRPQETVLTTMTATISGAEISVTNQFLFDTIRDSVNEGAESTFTATIFTVSSSKVSMAVECAYIAFAIGLVALPCVVCYARGDYTGGGSILYLFCGFSVRLCEAVLYKSCPPRDATKEVGLLYNQSDASAVVIARSNNGGKNAEDIAHPLLKPRFGKLSAIIYRSVISSLLIGWLAFLVTEATNKYRNGYIELATMVISALGEFLIVRLHLKSTIETVTVEKKKAINLVMWLFANGLVSPRAIPASLLRLRDDQISLGHKLIRSRRTLTQEELSAVDDGILFEELYGNHYVNGRIVAGPNPSLVPQSPTGQRP